MVEVLEEIPTEKNTEKSTENRHICVRKFQICYLLSLRIKMLFPVLDEAKCLLVVVDHYQIYCQINIHNYISTFTVYECVGITAAYIHTLIEVL